jgi:hypothetical protein
MSSFSRLSRVRMLLREAAAETRLVACGEGNSADRFRALVLSGMMSAILSAADDALAESRVKLETEAVHD